jgi:GNAT superfamily N-acetyltransferase
MRIALRTEMIIRIRNADELSNFGSCLADIDEIFFEASARQDFGSDEEKRTFREMSLGRYIERHRDSFFVALDDTGCAVGYLAGCLENPTNLSHFDDVSYFKWIEDICREYPAHIHVNISEPYRNRGLGSMLVKRFAELAKLRAVGGIHLVTSSASRSIPFYRKSGFVELRTFYWNSGTSVCMGRKV